VEPVVEPRRDPEVPAATPQRPQELGVRVRRHLEDRPICGHELGADEVVAGQPAQPHQEADAATEGQPADPGVDEGSARHREAVGLGGRIEVLPLSAATGAGPPPDRIDRHVPHPAQVDDEAVIDEPVAGHAMAAAADGDREIVRSRETNGPGDLSCVGALRNQRGSAVDHRVEGTARVVVTRVPRLHDGPTEAAPELVDRLPSDGHWLP